MAFDYSKLRGRIVEKYKSQAAFSKAFGLSENSLCRKMTNKGRFSTDDIVRISKMLEIPAAELHEYFFTQKV